MSVIVTLLLVASVAINLWFLRRGEKPNKQSVRSTLLQGIKNVRELTTLRQNFQSVVMFKDSKAFFGFAVPGTGRRFILKYGGVITCGSDLENIQITERFAVNRVRMVVPRARLLDIYPDMKSVQVYDQSAGIFTSVALSDQNREIAGNLEEVRQDAMQNDILRRADENTRMVLTSLAASLGMEAEVIFDDRDPTAADTSKIQNPDAQPEDMPVPLAYETAKPLIAEASVPEEHLPAADSVMPVSAEAVTIVSHYEDTESESENIPEL